MEEIKDNEYIRTNRGTIAKIEDTEFDIKTNSFGQILYEIFVEGNRYYEVILKHSPNIIDLVEVGDYVNGSKVINKLYENEEYIPTTVSCLNENWFKNQEIKSIVTKEQFENIEYRLEYK